jgi:hypothetical protein
MEDAKKGMGPVKLPLRYVCNIYDPLQARPRMATTKLLPNNQKINKQLPKGSF